MVYNSQYSKRKTSTTKNFFGKEINIMLCKFVKPLDPRVKKIKDSPREAPSCKRVLLDTYMSCDTLMIQSLCQD